MSGCDRCQKYEQALGTVEKTDCPKVNVAKHYFYIYVMYLSEAFVQCNVIMLSFTDRRLVCGMLL